MEALTLKLNNDQSEVLESVIREFNNQSVEFTQTPIISAGGDIKGYDFEFKSMSTQLIFSLGSLFGKEMLMKLL